MHEKPPIHTNGPSPRDRHENDVTDVRKECQLQLTTALSESKEETTKKLSDILTSGNLSWDYNRENEDILNRVLSKIIELIEEWADPNTTDENESNTVKKFLRRSFMYLREPSGVTRKIIQLIELWAEIDSFCFVALLRAGEVNFCRKLVREWFRLDRTSEEDWHVWMGNSFGGYMTGVRKQLMDIFGEQGISPTELTKYHWDSLITMIRDENITGVQAFLSTLDSNRINFQKDKETALSVCCGIRGDVGIKILELLIAEWAQDNAWTAFLNAIHSNNFQCVKMLFDRDMVDMQTIAPMSFSILSKAIANNAIAMVKFLQEKGLDMSSTEKNTWRTLLDIVLTEHRRDPEMFEYIFNDHISRGSDISVMERAIRTFIDKTATLNEASVKMILKFRDIGALFDLNDTSFFYRSSRVTNKQCFTDFTKALRDGGAIELLHNSNGLMLACIHEDEDMIRYLITDGGVDIDGHGCFKDTPLIAVARHHKHTRIAELLLTLGAKHINAMGDGNFTPLLLAANEGNITLVQFFLNHGADVVNDGPRVIRRLSDEDIHNTDGHTADRIISMIQERIRKNAVRDLGI